MAQFSGVGGAPGIAIGPAMRLVTTHDEAQIADDTPEAALTRFAQAQQQAADTLRQVGEQFRAEGKPDEAGIFDAQAMLAEDEYLADEVSRLVRDEHTPLGSALDQTIAAMRATMEALDDEYLRERAADISAIGQEIHAALAGRSGAVVAIPPGAIILADDLTPSQTAGLRGGTVGGFATAHGGPTGHTAILARALGIPAAVGLGAALLDVADGTQLILDGGASLLIANPSEQELADFRQQQVEQHAIRAQQAQLRHQPGQLADGTPVALWANIGTTAEAQVALEHGAEGIGLFRTEFLFLDRTAPPDEQEQYEAYRAVLETMAGRTVVARTLDIGGDKPLPYLNMPAEPNPFLGVRGLRLCMQRPDLFHTQLRALLRAACHGDLWIMLPMVATPADLAWGKAQLAEAAMALAQAGIDHRADLPLGVMIETPAAVATADLLAAEAAFFSIGSNDLTQYAMAADRGLAPLAAQYSHSSPAVFRLIAQTAAAARAAGIPLGMCGELAGEAQAAAALAGIGVHELSMVPAAIPAVKAHLATVSLDNAKQLAATAQAQNATP